MAVPSKNVLCMFVEVACASPQQVAIELDEQTWTYGELMANVIRVAQQLQIEIGEIVYQYVDRSLEMVCGLLGIMCAGGVYFPLSLADPPVRIRSLLDNIQARFVLIHRSTRDRFLSINNHEVQLVDLEQILSMDLIEDVVERGNCYVFA